MKKFKYIFIGAVAMLPMVAFAKFDSIGALLKYLTDLLNYGVRNFLIALAFAWFLWGMAMYIKDAGDETKRNEGRFYMLWSVIALFVILAVWGLVGILADTFQVSTGIPGAPSSGVQMSPRVDPPYDFTKRTQ